MVILGDRILVKIVKKEKVSSGGIILPVTKSLACVDVEVIMVGTKSKFGAWEFGPRDILNIDNPDFAIHPYTEIILNKEQCFIVNENDINFCH